VLIKYIPSASLSPTACGTLFWNHPSALLGVDLHAHQLADELRDRLQEIVRSGAIHPIFQPMVDVDTAKLWAMRHSLVSPMENLRVPASPPLGA
jgi:hypothetical protein